MRMSARMPASTRKIRMRFRTMRSIVAFSCQRLGLRDETHAHPDLCRSIADGWLASVARRASKSLIVATAARLSLEGASRFKQAGWNSAARFASHGGGLFQ